MGNDASDDPIEYAKGIGPQRAKLFLRAGIKTIRDALYFLPYRYEDRTGLKKIANIRPGSFETVQGMIVFANGIRTRKRNFRIFEIAVNDGTGFLKVKWFNQPYLQKNLPVGQEVILSGMVKESSPAGIEMDSPEYELVSDDPDSFIHTKRIVPFYRATEGISQKQMRKIMFGIVAGHASRIPDSLPPSVIERNNLPPLPESLQQLHFPERGMDLALLSRGASVYHQRLVFEELFLFELGLAALKRKTRLNRGIAFSPPGKLGKKLLKLLPFELTAAQKRTLDDIRRDMRSPYPMNRLIQGDVGCGKTAVALLAMFDAVESGYQAALMAPTEILAGQHYINMR
ncbi:MAG: DNA helicase RecG, partial [Nitrospirota bacterium]|nr:DNA helicase RecG [Nitrospirota bacterium]